METALLAQSLVEARRASALTQEQVARRMGTTQTAVARAESGAVLPSWTWLERYAAAVGRPIALWVTFGSQRLLPPGQPPRFEEPETVAAKLRARRAALQRERRRRAPVAR